METNFSKGEWVCNKSIAPLTGIEGEIEVSTTDKSIVEWIALCHDSANANLISAAPDMFNALLDLYNDRETWSDLFESQQEFICRVLNKAIGSSFFKH